MENLLIDDNKLFYKGYLAVCDGVAKTLGGEGKLALLENANVNLAPRLTKDGVSVAESIRFTNKFENFGALQAIQAAARTLEKAGDNTTTALVFAQGFLRNMKQSKFNKKVEAGIEAGYLEVLKGLKTLAKPVDRDMLIKVATTSANNDSKIGECILEAFDMVGYDGIVNVEKDYESSETKVITQSGMKIDKGYLSPFFINNQAKATWEAEDVLVVSLATWQMDNTILDFISKNRKREDGNLQPILFVMEKENLDVRDKLLEFVESAKLNCCLVIVPGGHSEFITVTHLKDLALYTDGTEYTPKDSFIDAGYADKVVVTYDKTLITRSVVAEGLEAKIVELQNSDKISEDIQQRIQRLQGTSAMISVGGNSIGSIDEIYDRVDDAIRAVKSAVPEGYIAGGGSTLLYISHRMHQTFKNSDMQAGYNLVKKILEEPSRRILLNANRKQKRWFWEKDYFKRGKLEYGVGYNAKSDDVSNLLEDGIIDSAKAIRVALGSAKDSAVNMLLTNVIVTFPEYTKN
jgi:chaperonin GroEL